MDFQIKYYLGGDWKFFALGNGIDAASSEYACIIYDANAKQAKVRH